MHTLNAMVFHKAKSIAKQSIKTYREATGYFRCLPDFIIVGAQKAGTSSLHYYLSQHPQLKSSSVKEVHYFDGGLDPEIDNFRKGANWYKSHFPFRQNMSANEKVFEASPLYLFNPLVPQRIQQLTPNAKLIILLRNPTNRAISHYFHEKRYGRETLPIEEAFRAEEQRLRSCIENKSYKNEAFIRFSYKSRGLYRTQVQRYLEHFDSSNILIINSENFFQDPISIMREVCKFVDVNPDFTVNLTPKNIGKDKNIVQPEIYQYLQQYFSTHNQDLYSLIKVNFNWE